MYTDGKKPGLNHIVTNFLSSLQEKLPAYKLRALDAIEKCRTPYMGGHIEACECCSKVREAYNSCRNRHCPQCGAIDKERWIMSREADLLDIKYFHVVFTLPDKLNLLMLNNQAVMYNLLFHVVWDVMKDFGMTGKWLGGRIGVTSILHTTGQNLHFHPHLHLIVPGGALMADGKFKHARNRGKYLFNVEQLSEVFRARFVKQCRLLLKQGAISGKIPAGLFDKSWVVYAKQAFGGPKQVIRYLGRYTHRTAISNERILRVSEREVTFSWKDYRNGAKQVTTLPGIEFLRLFSQHILPPGFTRIRHYGFLSSASKTKSLATIRSSLKGKPAPSNDCRKPSREVLLQRMGVTPGVCKLCGGKMIILEIVPNLFRVNKRGPPLNKTCYV